MSMFSTLSDFGESQPMHLSSTEPGYVEPEYLPVDCMDDCMHAAACRMQWERAHGEWNDDRFGSADDLAKELGCGEECEAFEDSYNVSTSKCGVMRDAT